VGGHVTGRAGIGVGAPDPADCLTALEDREPLDSRLAQLDADADAAEAGANDTDRELATRSVAGTHDVVKPYSVYSVGDPGSGTRWPSGAQIPSAASL
jgi:hypothetical protein